MTAEGGIITLSSVVDGQFGIPQTCKCKVPLLSTAGAPKSISTRQVD